MFHFPAKLRCVCLDFLLSFEFATLGSSLSEIQKLKYDFFSRRHISVNKNDTRQDRQTLGDLQVPLGSLQAFHGCFWTSDLVFLWTRNVVCPGRWDKWQLEAKYVLDLPLSYTQDSHDQHIQKKEKIFLLISKIM